MSLGCPGDMATATEGAALNGQQVSAEGDACWPALDDERLLSFLRHWAAGRKGALVPSRDAIDPAAIRNCLPNIWRYRFDLEQDDFVCTLAGQAVNEAWGFSLIGRSLAEIMPSSQLAVVRERYRRVLSVPMIEVVAKPILPNAATMKLTSRVILPLAGRGGQPSELIGMTVYAFPAGQPDLPVDTLGKPQDIPCHLLPETLP